MFSLRLKYYVGMKSPDRCHVGIDNNVALRNKKIEPFI